MIIARSERSIVWPAIFQIVPAIGETITGRALFDSGERKLPRRARSQPPLPGKTLRSCRKRFTRRVQTL
jgi:hypothetical protein